MLTDEDLGGSALEQIHSNTRSAATKAQLLSKHGSALSHQPAPGRNPRISKQEVAAGQSKVVRQQENFPPIPLPARLRTSSNGNQSEYSPAQPSRNGGKWKPTRDNPGDNDYAVGLSLDGGDSGGNTPKAGLTVADQIELSRRIQAQEMETAVNNMVCNLF